MPDGRDVSLMELAHEKGWKVTDAGYMVGRMKGDDGTVAERAFHFPYLYGKELPKPEDYILQLSAVTLEEIYQAGEWEQIGTRMPAPFSMADFNSSNNSTMLQASKPRPNIRLLLPIIRTRQLPKPKRRHLRRQRLNRQ